MDKYIGRMLDNRYEILELIGTGGMANVYKARCHRLNRLVAIKILKDDMAADADFRRRFETESQAVAMLSHPNIMAIYDVSRTGDVEYIVMELLDGITLKQYIQRKGALNWKEALHFTTQICKALSHAHSRGIIHRDIKPHNIMILRDGSVKVADFGIARLTSTQSTLTQEALGSVHYISPEQAKGSHIDARSDIYSVGVVLYEMLTNRLPYEGDSPVAVAIQHINSVPLMPREINPSIPEALEAITMKAMAADMEKRYPSADAMLDDLEEFRKNPNVAFSYSAADFAVKPDENEPTVMIPASAIVAAGTSGTNGAKNRFMKSDEQYEKAKQRRNKNRSARRVSTLAGIFAVVVFLLAMFYFLYAYFIKDLMTTVEDVEVPNLVGLDIDYVLESSAYSDFVIKVGEYVYDSDKPDGTILSQDPVDGRNVKPGQEITVTVSGGATEIPVPDVVNKEYRDAIREIEELGLTADPQFIDSDDVTSNYVISTSPEEGTVLKSGDTVTVYISTGPDIEMVTVPTLSGYTQYQAQRVLEQYGLSLGNVKQEYNDDVEIGIVYDQGVAAGTQVPEKFAVDIWISMGPEEEETDPPEETDDPTDPSVTTDPDDPSPPVTTDPVEPSPPVTTDPVEPSPPVTTDPVEPPEPSVPDGI